MYEYECPKCGRVVEVDMGNHTQIEPQCLMCLVAMERVYSAPAVHWPGGKPSEVKE